MPRIDGVPREKAGLLVRLAYWFIQSRFKKLLEPVRVTAHHPTVLGAQGAYELASERCARDPADLKELAQIKVATLVGCPF